MNSLPPGEPFTSKLEGPLLLSDELLVKPTVTAMPGEYQSLHEDHLWEC
ncbi:MAG: hypothetical protein KIT83_01690 [Bryobacterales bacterium]|nr:hypothetical protein [Bryobacterales bacterium]